MASSNSPSPPHTSAAHPDKHVDIRMSLKYPHRQVKVKNDLAAHAISATLRMQARDEKGKTGQPNK